MVTFPDMVRSLERLGVLDVLVPFLLIFTIIYAILLKTKILGEKKEFNIVIALVFALAVIIPHVMGWYPPDGDVVDIINGAIPSVSIVIVAVVMVLIIVGIFGGELSGQISGWIVVLAILVVAFIFAVEAGWWQDPPRWLDWALDPETEALIITVLVFGIIVWFITKEPKAEGEKGVFGKIMKAFEDLYKK